MFNLNGVIFTRLEVAHHLYCGCVTAPPWEYVKPGDELSSMHIVQWQWKTFHLNGVRIYSTGTSLFSTAWLWRNRCLFISGELPPPLGGSGPPPNTWFFGPTRVHNPNGTSIRSVVSLQRTVFYFTMGPLGRDMSSKTWSDRDPWIFSALQCHMEYICCIAGLCTCKDGQSYKKTW